MIEELPIIHSFLLFFGILFLSHLLPCKPQTMPKTLIGKKGFSSGFQILSGRSRRSVDLTKLLRKPLDTAPTPAPILDDFDIPMDYDNTDQYGNTPKSYTTAKEFEEMNGDGDSCLGVNE